MKQHVRHTSDGYVVIAILLILAAVILSIVITVAQLGVGEGQASLALSKGEEALNRTESCMEDALLKIRADAGYAGGTVIHPEGTCSITVTTVGPVYTVTASTTGTSYTRTIQAVVNRSASMTITSWREQ